MKYCPLQDFQIKYYQVLRKQLIYFILRNTIIVQSYKNFHVTDFLTAMEYITQLRGGRSNYGIFYSLVRYLYVVSLIN